MKPARTATSPQIWVPIFDQFKANCAHNQGEAYSPAIRTKRRTRRLSIVRSP